MLNESQIAEIKARGVSAIVKRKRYVVLTVQERDALLADRDELVRRLATVEGLLRRYHERVTAADDMLAGIIASRGYLNDAMSKLPHPTIGDEVSAALAPAAPLASAGAAATREDAS